MDIDIEPRLALLRQAESLQISGNIAGATEIYRSIPGLLHLLTIPGKNELPVWGPHFVIIGAARAGTTWLKYVLAQHPDVFIANGEPQYFSDMADTKPLSWYVKEIFGPDAGFKRKSLPKHFARVKKIYGEKSPAYLTMPDANIDLMAAAFPKLKIICNVRDPAAREASHFRHHAIDPFSAALEDRRAATVIKESSWYNYHIRRFAMRFTAKRILRVDFERIASEPEALYAEVLQHIGARPAELPDSARVKVGSVLDAPVKRRRRAFADVPGRAVFTLGDVIDKGLDVVASCPSCGDHEVDLARLAEEYGRDESCVWRNSAIRISCPVCGIEPLPFWKWARGARRSPRPSAPSEIAWAMTEEP